MERQNHYLFHCTLCDDDSDEEGTSDSGGKFERFADISRHVRETHSVATEEGIQSVIMIPAVQYLGQYQCSLCLQSFVSNTDHALILSHFTDQHNTKKVRANQLKRICRICDYDKCKTDSELSDHIKENHPSDLFAQDDMLDEDFMSLAKNNHERVVATNHIKEAPAVVNKQEIVTKEVIRTNSTEINDIRRTAMPTTYPAPIRQPQPPYPPNDVTTTFVRTFNIVPSDMGVAPAIRSQSPMSLKLHLEDSEESATSSSSSSGAAAAADKKRLKKLKRKKKERKRRRRKIFKKLMYDEDDGSPVEEPEKRNEEQDSDVGAADVRVIHQPGAATGSHRRVKLEESDVRNDVDLSDGEFRDSLPPRLKAAKNLVVAKRKREAEVAQSIERRPKTPDLPRRFQETVSKDAPSSPPHRSQRHGQQPARFRKSFDTSHSESSGGEDKESRRRRHRSDSSDAGSRESRRHVRTLQDEYFCDDCQVTLNDENARDHFTSSHHRMRTRNKVRCYLCSKYVENTKMHLEKYHQQDVFQCKGERCSNPKFLDLVKILNHVHDKHYVDMRNQGPDDLIRSNMIAVPVNLCSYKCKLCNRRFVGQSLDRVLEHQRWEDGKREPRESDVCFFCRICGGQSEFDDEAHLQDHVRYHHRYNQQTRKRRYSSGGESSGRRSSRRTSRSSTRSPAAGRSSSQRQQSSGGGGGGQKQQRTRDYCPCIFCPQVTENTDSDKMSHQIRNHSAALFRCKQCGDRFRSASRFGVFEHLRNLHKNTEMDEDDLLKCETILPKDIRRIYCVECQREKKGKVYEWCCQDIIEVEKELREHMEEHHPKITLLANIIRLGCRACNDHYDFDLASRREWKEHTDTGHRISAGGANNPPAAPETTAAASRRSRSRQSSTRSKTSRRRDSSSSSNSSSVERSHSGRRTAQKAADLEVCSYCCAFLAHGETTEEHVKAKHGAQCFACLLCPADSALFEDHGQLCSHFEDEHKEEEEAIGDNSQVPEDLRCVRCNICQINFHAVGLNEMKMHFSESHKKSSSGFESRQLDFKCRICMESGVYKSEGDLLEHLGEKHGSFPTATAASSKDHRC